MSGIAIIIPNADFSDSPLGNVTFELTSAEKAELLVNDYATKIGTTAYNDSLKTLLTTLYDLDVVDKMSIYPMLGSTIGVKGYNLLPSRKGYNNTTIGDITFDENASALTKGVSFTATSAAKTSRYYSEITDKLFLYSSFARKAQATNDLLCSSGDTYKFGVVGSTKIGASLFNEESVSDNVPSANTFVNLSAYVKVDSANNAILFKGNLNGVEQSEATAEYRNTRDYIYRGKSLGIKASGGNVINSLDANVRIFVSGNIDEDLVLPVRSALDVFVESVY